MLKSISGGGVGYAATPTEIANSVVIVNGFELPGTPNRYATNAIPGTTDMTAAWQIALTNNQKVVGHPGELYAVNTSALIDQAGATITLNVPTNTYVDLNGCTVLKIGSAQQGAIFGSAGNGTTTLEEKVNVRISNGTINCNGLASGAVIFSSIDSVLGPFLTVLSSAAGPAGISLGFRASNGAGALAPVKAHGRNRIIQNTIRDSLFLGIQCAHQPLGLLIDGNTIANSGDNAIDIEGGLNVQSSALTITAITKDATGATITWSNGAANTLELGEEVSFSGVVGMTQINGLSGTVSAIGGVGGAWTAKFGGVDSQGRAGGSQTPGNVLYGYGLIDSSGFTAYSSGGTGTVGSPGRRITVVNNIINGVASDCGIFIESAGNFLVDNNTIDNVIGPNASGIVVNTAYLVGTHGLITHNRITNVLKGQGLYIQASTKLCIADNTFAYCLRGIAMRNGASFCSFGVNTYEAVLGPALITVDAQPTNGMVWSNIVQQMYNGARNANSNTYNGTDGYPFTMSPIDNAQNYSNRTFFPRQTVAANILQSGGPSLPNVGGGFSDLQVEYQSGVTGVLVQNFTGGTLWSEYNVGVANETQIKLTAVGGAWTLNRYIWINGTVPTLYQLVGSQGSGLWTIRKCTTLALSGNTAINATSAALNVAYPNATNTLSAIFSDGVGNYYTRAVLFTNGQTAISWSGAIPNVCYANVNILGVPGNYTGNFTGPHPCTEYYREYQET
jgi:hypothetical protein